MKQLKSRISIMFPMSFKSNSGLDGRFDDVFEVRGFLG